MNAVEMSRLRQSSSSWPGSLGLVYGGFSYTKETHEPKLGPIELSVQEKETVNVPVWAGVGAIETVGVILLLGTKRT